MAGRPPKLTKRVRERVCRAIRATLTLEQAAAYGGICYDTLNEWRKQGQADLEAGAATPFSEFSEAVEAALLDAELTHAETVATAGKGGKKVVTTQTVTKRAVPGSDDLDRFFDEVTGQEEAEPGAARLRVVEETTTRTEQTLAPQWRASAWILERRHPERWRRHQQQDWLRAVDFSKLTPEQLDRLASGEDPIRVLFGA